MKRRTVAPTALVTLDEVKAQCVISHADDDALLTRLISAASDFLDGPDARIGRALVTQTWEVDFGPLSGSARLNLPVAPLIALSGVTYYDRDNVQQTMTAGSEVLLYADNDRAYITPALQASWPAMYNRPDAFTVTFTAGYGPASDVPENIRHAALALISHWYENRDAVSVGNTASEVPMLVDALIDKDRLGWVGS